MENIDKEVLIIKEQLKDALSDIQDLKEKRISQASIPPQTVKQRHLGEGPMFIRAGLEADLPTIGENTTSNSTAIYFCTDSFKLKIWTGSSWKSTTLS